MPIYNYRCVDCGQEDTRLAGPHDHAALCTECGGLMLRTDIELFAPLLYGAQLKAQAFKRFRLALAEGRRELEEI